MGQVIVITSGKGGVGKSTTAANLGVSLAKLGSRCALIDMDMGLRSLDVLLGVENRVVYDLYDVAAGFCRMKQALMRHPDFENLFLLNASQTCGGDAITKAQVREVVCMIRDTFDYLLIDCPAGIGRGFQNAVGVADRAILVATPDVVTLRDAERVTQLLTDAGLPAPELLLNRVLPEQMKPDCEVSPEAFTQRLRLSLLGLIPNDEAMYRAACAGLPVARSVSEAGDAYLRAARRLRGEEIPVKPVRRAGFFKRLSRAF